MESVAKLFPLTALRKQIKQLMSTMTSFKWLWSISTVQQESAHCPHTHTYSQMHQQTNKLVNQIWTETITRHWWSPVISAAFLLFISVMIIRGLTSTRHFCNQPSHNIFLQHDRSCCHVNFRSFFFCSYKQVQWETVTLLQLTATFQPLTSW